MIPPDVLPLVLERVLEGGPCMRIRAVCRLFLSSHDGLWSTGSVGGSTEALMGACMWQVVQGPVMHDAEWIARASLRGAIRSALVMAVAASGAWSPVASEAWRAAPVALMRSLRLAAEERSPGRWASCGTPEWGRTILRSMCTGMLVACIRCSSSSRSVLACRILDPSIHVLVVGLERAIGLRCAPDTEEELVPIPSGWMATNSIASVLSTHPSAREYDCQDDLCGMLGGCLVAMENLRRFGRCEARIRIPQWGSFGMNAGMLAMRVHRCMLHRMGPGIEMDFAESEDGSQRVGFMRRVGSGAPLCLVEISRGGGTRNGPGRAVVLTVDML